MWQENIKEVERLREKSREGGGQARIDTQHKAGKLTARERIDLLLDQGSFVEVNGLVESRIDDFGLDKRRVPGDGVVTGYGTVNGRTVCVASEDFTVIGGTSGEYHSMKICRMQDMALQMKVPFIAINDSGGARIEEGISALSGYGEMFLRNTKASGVIPQIAVIVGPCSGGACYSPAICDFIFMVEKISKMFITGPKVVQSVLGEVTTIEELGGTAVHAHTSGVSHFTYQNEQECFAGVRRLLSYLPQNYLEKPPVLAGKPVDRSSDIPQIVPDNPRRPYDVHQVIDTMVDEGSFLEIQKDFAANAVIGLGRIDGESVGFVANQPNFIGGSLDCDSSDKIARFIRFCDCFNIPLVTLVDVPAFMPGKEQEAKGIIRHGAKILYAYSEATVPKISLIMRKAYGGAYIAMNSKSMGADVVYAWPIAEVAVMGADGAISIIWKKQLAQAEDPARFTEEKIEEYQDLFMNPFIAAKRGYVDDVILPEETRGKIRAALDFLKTKQVQAPQKKHGNIPL